MPTPYMTEPALLESLKGQQYVVLRPGAAVAEFYRSEQSAVLGRLPGGIPHPHTGHVTLRGFFEPERVAPLRETIAGWARSRAPIDLRVEAVDGFPPPFGVLIARLERTHSLLDAYESLTALLDSRDFVRIGELPLDEWVFHLSLALRTRSTSRRGLRRSRRARARWSRSPSRPSPPWISSGTTTTASTSRTCPSPEPDAASRGVAARRWLSPSKPPGPAGGRRPSSPSRLIAGSSPITPGSPGDVGGRR